MILKISTLILLLCSSSLFAQTTATKSVPTPSVGAIRHFEQFPSAFLPARNVDVWLPAGYEEKIRSGKKFAVLYMHDGQMLFDTSITWNKQEWGVDETVSELLGKGSIRDCIVVGMWNSGKTRHLDYFPQKVFESFPQAMRDSLFPGVASIQSDAYLKFITQELKPFIDSTFATLKDRNNTFVAGSSMGGLISMYALCQYPSVFGGAACLSTHWVGNIKFSNTVIPRAFNRYIQENFPKPNTKEFTHKIYFDFGTKTLDSLYKPHQIMVDGTMRKKGYTKKNWITREFPGEDHSERAWAKRLALPLVFLLKKQ
ncbi:MAG: alpha/beta hydrolase [Candidatus Kapaibacteriota bacterium]